MWNLFARQPTSPGWKFIGWWPSSGSAQMKIEGIDVWAHPWVQLDDPRSVELTDPIYRVPITCFRARVDAGGRSVVFAYTEISNGKYLFFVPR